MSDTKTEFMAFPSEKKDALAKAQQQRMQSVAHFPKPLKVQGVPMMMPTEDKGPNRPAPQQRPGIAVHHQSIDDIAARQQQLAAQNQNRQAQPSAMVQHRVPQQAKQVAQPQPRPIAQAIQQPQHGEDFSWVHQSMQQHETAPDMQNQRPNPMPGFQQPVADSSAFSLGLPSRFAFYGFKDIYCRPFLAKHIAKLQKAHREQSLQPVVEAVSSVLYTSDPAYANVPLAFELTLPDFYFVLFWLRQNSFTKSNFVHTTRCKNPEHTKKVDLGLRLEEYQAKVRAGEMSAEHYAEIEASVMPESSLEISQVITNASVDVKELETIPDPEVYHFSDASTMLFRPPTMRDVIEFSEHPKMADADQRTEFSFLAQLATHIQHQELYLNLDQRIEIVENATADQVQLIKDYDKAVRNYGVDQTVKIQCKGCGAVSESKLSLAAHSFFPAS
jgi:hypothetical protein